MTLRAVSGDGVIERPLGITAPITQAERYRSRGSRFGSLEFPQLLAIFAKRDMGYLDDWADLVEFIFRTDTDIAGLASTRVARVTQATFRLKPNVNGDSGLAQQAVELCNQLLARIENFHETKKHLLHAIFAGAAFAEKEWDTDHATQTNFIRKFHLTHAHRFRYDEQWEPRLYDQGARKCADTQWGETLDPLRWVVHHHYEMSGYPNVAGIMAPASVTWLYKRIVEKFYAHATEKAGDPIVWLEITSETNPATRQMILATLAESIYNRVAVVEKGGMIHFEWRPGASGGDTAHSVYLDRANGSLAKLFHGASDTVDPGDNGSKAAVGVRAGATMDPKMIDDGLCLSSTLQRDVLFWLLAMNRHKFGGVMPPVPSIEAVTASDEVQTDTQDLAEQTSGRPAEISSGGDLGKTLGDGEPAVTQPADTAAPAPNAPKLADTALNGAQITSLIDVLKTAAAGELPRDSVVAIIRRGFNMDLAAVEEILGTIGKGFVVPSAAPPSDSGSTQITAGAATDPKALSRRPRRQPTQMELTHTSSAHETTSQISTASARILAEALRGASVVRER